MSVRIVLAMGLMVLAVDGAAAEAPGLLSQTGLYAAGGLRIAEGNLAYAPQYPLWSDGAAKARWAYLPPGQRIDTRDGDAWQFPVGTKFWKEFRFHGRKVETRLLWRATADGWVYATYAWNRAQTEATLAPAEGLPTRVRLAPGRTHSLPSVADCKACHENGRFEVLGFSALQLSSDRDPLAPHAEKIRLDMATLARLEQAGRFSPARPEWLASPPRIRAGSPRERAALGYLSTNCGSCHKAEGPVEGYGLFLKHTLAGPAEPGLATSLGQASPWDLPKAKPGTTQRIQAGHPERSAALYRMARRGAKLQMPPLATVLVDRQAVALVRAWIAELKNR